MDFMWTPPNFPDDAVRAELHISGPEEVVKYLYDLITDIEEPFTSHEGELDGYIFVYTSKELAQQVFDRLHERLQGLHPGLIGHPEGVNVEDDNVLYFKECEVYLSH